MNDLLARLTRIRNRMRAFAEHPSAKTAESYRALLEVAYAELDVIVRELEQVPDEAARLRVVMARALERTQVADDPSGAADEATATGQAVSQADFTN